jgi:signal transduction histidine kinase
MIGYVDVLLGESVGILGSNQRKYLERIKVSTERFGHILEELVQASLVESESTSIQNQTFDLRQLIEEASNEAIKSFQHRSISLQTNLPEKPLMINTDRENLQEVITLLVRNAGSVTNEREVVEVTALIESSETEPDYFLIQVADKGGGIPTQDLTRVFSSLPSGTVIEGLGEPGIEFVRIKALIEALGGRIWVDSEPGVGSVFSVLLPALPISEDESNSYPAGVN